jgi:hypothetical protein
MVGAATMAVSLTHLEAFAFFRFMAKPNRSKGNAAISAFRSTGVNVVPSRRTWMFRSVRALVSKSIFSLHSIQVKAANQI